MDQMFDVSVAQYWHLGVAIAIGFLVGLERGFHLRDEGPGTRLAGIRTFTLAGLLGGIAGLLTTSGAGLTAALLLFSLLVVTAISHAIFAFKEEKYATTTSLAILLTFALGFLANFGLPLLAAAAATIATVVLSLRGRLHGLLDNLRFAEVRAVLEFLVLSVVLLPLLPNQGYGPGEVLNPRNIWLMAVLVAGLSFAGYLAVKLAGARAGLLLTGFAGGLASSTAVTVTVARMASKNKSLSAILAAAAALASSIMLVRIGVLVSIVHWPLLTTVGPTIGAMALASFAGAAVLIYYSRKSNVSEVEPENLVDNPLDLASAVGFAALLAVVILLAYYLKEGVGDIGLYALAGVSGLTDVDAITITVSGQVADALGSLTGARAIVIAAIANTVVKFGIAAAFSGGKLALRLALALTPAVVVGFAGIALI